MSTKLRGSQIGGKSWNGEGSSPLPGSGSGGKLKAEEGVVSCARPLEELSKLPVSKAGSKIRLSTGLHGLSL